ncbi:ferrous iron transporter B, partial [Rothia sp. 32237D007AR]
CSAPGSRRNHPAPLPHLPLPGPSPGSEAIPDALLLVADATTLRRSLTFLSQALALGKPAALVLTMVDELRAGGGELDVQRFAQALGVPVVEVVAHRGRGVQDVRALLADIPAWPTLLVPPPVDDPQELNIWIDSVLSVSDYRPPAPNRITRGIDRYLLHPVGGSIIFFAVMFLFFQTIFAVAAPAQDAIEQFFAFLGEAASSHITHPVLADFVNTALIGGMGGVLVFIPQILLLYLLISILESVGYMSRAAFLMDRVMAYSGLDGRAFVAMLSSMACAVPGIMATRTMPSSRDRLATIVSAPLMTCSARLPIYVLLIGLLIPADSRVGPFSTQGVALFAMYLLGGLAAMLVAALFKSTILRRGTLPFYLEMPPYRLPAPRALLTAVWVPVWMFIRKAGTIILVATTILWGLMSFPAQTEATEGMSDAEAAAYVLDHSYAAAIGKSVEPIFEPLGFEWRINVGLIGSFAAREVFVSTMGQVVAAEDIEDPSDALAAMTYTSGEHAGEKVMTAPTLVALLVFYAFAMQCVSTLVVMRRETNSLRWPAFTLVYMFVLAWVGAWLARTITVWWLG